MANHQGDHLRARRLAQGLRPGDLARRLGYHNLTKGARRVLVAEAGGRVEPGLLACLATLLGIPGGEVERLADLDSRAWEEWADQPVRPHLILRWLPGVYGRVELPGDPPDLESAEAFAARSARERGVRACLVWSRRLAIYFDPLGTVTGRCAAAPGRPSAPAATAGGRAVWFRPVDPPGETGSAARVGPARGAGPTSAAEFARAGSVPRESSRPSTGRRRDDRDGPPTSE